MARPRKEGPDPTQKREGKVHGWGQRMMRGMDQSPEEALEQSQEVLRWSLRKHGPDAPFSVKAMNEVANQLATQDRVGEEAVLREQIVTGLRKNLGPEHDSTLNAELKLAMCLTTLERPEEAEPLVTHVVAGRALALGEDDPRTLAAMAWSASVAKKLGQLQDAGVLQEQVVAGYESRGEAESAHALLAALNLASTRIELHQFDEASHLLRFVLEVRSRTLGPDDPRTLEVRQVLASVGDDQRRG